MLRNDDVHICVPFVNQIEGLTDNGQNLYEKAKVRRCYILTTLSMCPYMKSIKNNAWVTVDNDFWTRVRWFFRATKSRVTIIGKSRNEWPKKTAMHGNECIISFLTRYFVKEGLLWLGIVTSPQLICDVMRTWGNSIVTAFSSIVLARANRRKGDLH